MRVRGRIVAGVLVAATVVAAALVGPSDDAPTVQTETVELTLAPASEDTRWRAAIEGRLGSTVNGAHTILPANADGDTDYYLWWSHNGNNLDPGDHVAALSGMTGIEVALGSGAISASARATATCTAIDGAAIADWDCDPSGAVATITGTIDAATVEVGGAWTARGAAGLFGSHTREVLTNGNPFNAVIAVHGTFDDGPAVLTSLCVLLGTAEADDTVRLGLYTGGSSTWGATPTLAAECTTAGSGSNYACCGLDDGDSITLADNTSVWLLAKADQDGDATHPAFSGPNEDWTDRNLVIVETGIDNDPAVAYPANLSGTTISEAFDITMMASFETRALPLVGDASLGGTTTNGLVLGVHCDQILGASESALTSPDAGGANVSASMVTPNILGMLLTRREVAVGGTHTGQFRLGEYTGGAIANPNGATLVQDHGQTAGSSTNAWVGINASPEVAIAANDELHITTRGNGNITIRFAASGNEETVDCPDSPSDFATAATDEYETNTANPAHSTNPAVGFETPFATDADDITPDNYPGVRILYRVPGDDIALP